MLILGQGCNELKRSRATKTQHVQHDHAGLGLTLTIERSTKKTNWDHKHEHVAEKLQMMGQKQRKMEIQTCQLLFINFRRVLIHFQDQAEDSVYSVLINYLVIFVVGEGEGKNNNL